MTTRVHLTFAGYSKLLRLNTDIFIRSLCLQAAFAFMTFHGAGLGDNTVAANAVLLNLLLLIAYALDGIAYYAEAEVGKAYGQNAHSHCAKQYSSLGVGPPSLHWVSV